MSIIAGAVNLWSRTSRTMKIVGYVGAGSAALVSAAQAWPMIEPYLAAHRGYVRAYEDGQRSAILQRLIRVQLNQNHDKRQQLLDEAAKRELELQSDQAKQLPQYKALVQERVDRIKSELQFLDNDDNNLFKEKIGK